jgi:hypothetical protein
LCSFGPRKKTTYRHLIQCSSTDSPIVRFIVSQPFFILKVSNFIIIQLVKVKIHRCFIVYASVRVTCTGTSACKHSHLFFKMSYRSQIFRGRTTVCY